VTNDITTGRSGASALGAAMIDYHKYDASSIVDLDGNSIICKGETWCNAKLKSKWDTPPDYEYLREAIAAAINQAIEVGKTKY
jgi:hypothetical protein